MKNAPIMSVQGDNGSIKLIHYQSRHLIVPVVNKLLMEGIYGSTCILVKTNEEALQVTGLLQRNGIRAKLIQSNERYELYNLAEVRYFLEELDLTKDTYIIQDEVWGRAKNKLKARYAGSTNFSVCEQMLKDFEETNNKYKYVSDLPVFLRESVEEDFYHGKQEAVCAATIHKSKGREFDHLIIILSDFYLGTEEAKRQLYVGMTPAKKSLTIHYNGDCMDNQRDSSYGIVENLEYETNNYIYEASNLIIMQLGYKDVYLSYFYKTQGVISKLISGDELKVDGEGCYDQYGNRVLIFSGKFKNEVKTQQARGYYLLKAKVNHVLYWRQEDTDEEIMVVFPEVEFIREE